LINDPALIAGPNATGGLESIPDWRKKSAQLESAELMRIGGPGWIGAHLKGPTPSKGKSSEMRTLLTVIAFLAAAAVVDNLWLDGRYSLAVWDEANYQGQQFRYQAGSIVGKLVGR
jgi:hypothetical protein